MLEDASLWQEFAAESEEHLDAIERLLSQAGAPDRAAVNSLFRAFHSLKGMSAALGAPGMTAVAHACEDFLGLARSGERRIADAAADALLAAVDAMRRQRDALLATRQDAPPPPNLLARLHRLSGAEAMPAAPAPRTPGEAPAASGLPGLHVAPPLLASLVSRATASAPLLASLTGGRTPAALAEAESLALAAGQLGLRRLAETLRSLPAAADGLALMERLGLLSRQLDLLRLAAREPPGAAPLAARQAAMLSPGLAALAMQAEALAAGTIDPAGVAAAARALAAAAAASGLDSLETLLLRLEDLADRAADPDAAATIAVQGPALAERLRAAAEGGAVALHLPEAAGEPADPRIPPDFAAVLSLDARTRLVAALDGGQSLFRAQLALGQSGEIEAALGAVLRDAAEVLGSRPRPDTAPPQIDLLLASARPLQALQQAIQAVDPQQRVLLSLVPADPAHGGPGATRGAPVTIRVRQETIDEIIGLEAEVRAGALALSEALQDADASEAIARLAALERRVGGGAGRELREASDLLHRFQQALQAAENRLTLSLRRLDDVVMELRVVPIATLFARLPRAVRAVAQAGGKEVDIVFGGEEVAIDRSVIELLADPLLHLVRNAVDHGIELPAQRRAAGKPPRATLRVSAERRTGQVRVTVTDDGRGIDVTRVLSRAVERGLIPAEAAAQLPEAEVHALLFRPGFSTAERVTETSGRGVGLDVVQEAVRRVGGTLEVTSLPGQGTSFILLLPLTAAVQSVLLVEVAGHPYAIPDGRVEAVLQADDAAGFEVLSLSQALGLPDGTAGAVVVVRSGGRRFGLAVERVQRRADLLLRPLHPALAALPGLSGVGVLGSGEPVPLLEPDGLF